jgi:MEDS: MEthanogen/methylotroph, DcmR Sensory domain
MSDVVGVITRTSDAPTITNPVADLPSRPGSQPQLCGALLGARAHVCAFFRDMNEGDRALLPFIKAGLAAGEKIVHTIDPTRRADHMSRFAAAGIDFTTAHRRGQFDLHGWTDTHLRGGRFDPDTTLAFFSQIRLSASRQGYPLTRFITHMDWALKDDANLTDLLVYEARANEYRVGQPGPIDPVVCAYDLTRFSGEFIVDVMRTHPMTLIDGTLHENPFYVPPEEFIRELRNRRASRVVGSRL